MQRLNNDRGAVAVIVAILMVPLMGFAAISIDIAATYAERQQLQTGADAAALAIAQDCARSSSEFECAETPESTAQGFAEANKNDGNADARLQSVPTPSSGRVTVITEGVRDHWFAPVLGVESTDIRTSATAGWGYASAGTAVLPLVIPLCEFTTRTKSGLPSKNEPLVFPKKNEKSCTLPNKSVVPGGFGWLQTHDGKCQARITTTKVASSSPGKSLPKDCRKLSFDHLLGTTVLIPVFDGYSGGGNNATYEIAGFAAFVLTGYFFQNKQESPVRPCSQPAQCIKGYFTSYTDRAPGFEYDADAEDLGASAVYLLPDE